MKLETNCADLGNWSGNSPRLKNSYQTPIEWVSILEAAQRSGALEWAPRLRILLERGELPGESVSNPGTFPGRPRRAWRPRAPARQRDRAPCAPAPRFIRPVNNTSGVWPRGTVVLRGTWPPSGGPPRP